MQNEFLRSKKLFINLMKLTSILLLTMFVFLSVNSNFAKFIENYLLQIG